MWSRERLSTALEQVRAAFLEMPGLQLTLAQTARLCALDLNACEAALHELVRTGFLVQTHHARFARTNDIVSSA